MISIKEAAERLEVSASALCQTRGRYHKWYHPAEPGKKNAKFDIGGYLKHIGALEYKMTAAHHIVAMLTIDNGYTLKHIANTIDVDVQALSVRYMTGDTADKLLDMYEAQYEASALWYSWKEVPDIAKAAMFDDECRIRHGDKMWEATVISALLGLDIPTTEEQADVILNSHCIDYYDDSISIAGVEHDKH